LRFWAFFPVAMVASAQSLTENGSTLASVDILPPQVHRSTIDRRIGIDSQQLAGTPGNTVGAAPLKWFAPTPPCLRP
jgi:hypothetical protein